MLGAIIGDIIGSRFEWNNIKSKQFQLFKKQCHPTDDSVMTLAIAQALLLSSTGDGIDLISLPGNAVKTMQSIGRKYPNAGYGGRFFTWLQEDNPQPYNSWGNGAGMRVSPCAWVAKSLEEALNLSDAVTAVTHNHPEGIKGARAITEAIWLARNGYSQAETKKTINEKYYQIDFTLDQIRPTYKFDVSCQGSVPQAIEAFLESSSKREKFISIIKDGILPHCVGTKRNSRRSMGRGGEEIVSSWKESPGFHFAGSERKPSVVI